MRFSNCRRGWVRPRFMTIGGLLIGSMLFSACGPDFSSKTVKPSPVSMPTGNKNIRNKKMGRVTTEIVGLEPFRYQVTFRWAPELTNVSIFINRQFAFKAESSSVTSYSVGLDHHREYLVTVYAQKDQDTKPTVVTDFTLQTPLDVILSTDFLNSAPAVENSVSIRSHRVFVIHRVITNGRNILLNTDELIAEDTLISTFEEDRKATLDTIGRGGGTIVIKSQRAKGQIGFVFRGENGGDGKDGEPYTERALSGGNGLDGYDDYWDAARGSRLTCGRPPGDGKPGATGSKGRNGSNGRAGGSSGSLHLEIAEPSPEFHFTTAKETGVAGSHGRGGPGQLGGLGGKPGNPSQMCPKAKTGLEGKQGQTGENGIREHDGILEQDCVSIGEGFGRCS